MARRPAEAWPDWNDCRRKSSVSGSCVTGKRWRPARWKCLIVCFRLPGATLRERTCADFSAQSLYRRIRDARTQARDIEKQALQGDSGRPDWKPVIELSRKALIKQSKDLQIAAWMTEALLRIGGFAGLDGGIRLMSGLVEKFWDALYPMPDEEGISTRVAALTGLNGEDGEGVLVYPISNVPIIPADGVAYGLSAYQQARSLAAIADEDVRQNRISRGAVTVEMLQAAASSAPPEFAASIRDQIKQCLASWDELCKLLTEKCGNDAPPASKIRELLVEASEMTTRFYPNAAADAPAEPTAAHAEAQAGPATTAAAGPMVAGAIANREQAFGTLQKVATFFKRTEPHSPVSYALEQAVRWGQMPLPQLLTELISEESTLKSVYKLIGIPQEAKHE